MDTISAGSTIALAYYLYDQGVINSADTGGLPLKWGDIDTVIALVEQIAQRQGFGDALAEGAKRGGKARSLTMENVPSPSLR